jgi:signal peptidase II
MFFEENETIMKKKLVLAFLCIAVLTGFDQFVKYLTVLKLERGKSYVLINKVFQLTHVRNYGAAWSSFTGKRFFLLAVTLVVLVVLCMLYIRMSKLDMFKDIRVLLVFLISGALGNIIDRVVNGYVVDMFDFCLINFPVFNVADIYVTCSVILLFFIVIFKYKDGDFDILKKSQ